MFYQVFHMGTCYILGMDHIVPGLCLNLHNNKLNYNRFLLWLSNTIYKFYIWRNQTSDELYYFLHIAKL